MITKKKIYETMLNYKIIRTVTELEAIKNQWFCLEKCVDHNNPFGGYYWIYNFLTYVEEDTNIFFILVYQENSLISVFPLVVKKRLNRTVNCLELAGGEYADYQGLLISERYFSDIVKTIYKCLCDYKQEWHLMDLKYINEKDLLTVKLLSYLKDLFKVSKMMFVDKEYYITFRESKGIYQPIRKSLKQKLNSYINRTKYYSKFQIRHLHQDVYDLFDLLKINWPNSIFNNNNIFNFYLYLMDRHNITNSSIAAFMFNGESIVLNWLFESENQVIAQLVVRKKDVSISRFSPGALCYFYLINETKNKGINTFSFGRGNEEYKQKWTNKYNQIYRYIIVNNNIVNNNKYFTSYVKLLNS